LHHKLAKGLEEKEGSKKLMKIAPMEEDNMALLLQL
jgi:hypothetical protein